MFGFFGAFLNLFWNFGGFFGSYSTTGIGPIGSTTGIGPIG